jgi:hypothetical protein
MAKDNGVRFSVYFRKEQVEYMDKEAQKLGISRSKYLERALPLELQVLENRKGAEKKGKAE